MGLLRLQPFEDGPQRLDPRRYRLRVEIDELAQRSDKRGAFVVGNLQPPHDGNMVRNRRDDQPMPLTLGQALAAKVRLLVWCKGRGQRIDPDLSELIERRGEAMAVIDRA